MFMLVSVGGMAMCFSACISPQLTGSATVGVFTNQKNSASCVSKPLWTTEVHDLSALMTWDVPNILGTIFLY